MIDSTEYSELGRSTETKFKSTERDAFAKTIKSEGTVISYKFLGGTYSKRKNYNNFEITLATSVHQPTGLIIKLVENDMLVGASNELAQWCEDQVIADLSNIYGIEEA